MECTDQHMGSSICSSAMWGSFPPARSLLRGDTFEEQTLTAIRACSSLMSSMSANALMALKDQADDACGTGDFRLAAILYTQVLRGGACPAVLLNRSVALSGLQQWQDALADIQLALTLRPEWSKAHYRLGSVLLSLGQPTEALDAIQTALLLQPHNKAATTLLKQAEDASRCHFRQQRQGTCEPVTSRPGDSEVEGLLLEPAETPYAHSEAEVPAWSCPRSQAQPAEGNHIPAWQCTVLGAPEAASRQQIRQAYLEKVAYAHPDKGGSAAEFHLLQQAYKALTQGLVHKDTPNLHTATSQRQPSMELTDKEYLAWHLKVARDSHAEGVAALATGDAQAAVGLLTCAISHVRGIAAIGAFAEFEGGQAYATHDNNLLILPFAANCGEDCFGDCGKCASVAAGELLQMALGARADAFCEMKREQQALADVVESGRRDTCQGCHRSCANDELPAADWSRMV